MDMYKVTAKWAGFPGAPGYSTFFFNSGGGLITDAQQVATRVRDSFLTLASALPSSIGIEVQDELEIIDADTGVLSGYETVDGGLPVTGLSGGGYSAVSGAVVSWSTEDVRFGRRIRGRTFLVPLAGTSYEADGSLSGNVILKLKDFAEVMTGTDFDSEFGIWSRPRNGTGGVFASVTSSRIPDMAAVLKSRRD